MDSPRHLILHVYLFSNPFRFGCWCFKVALPKTQLISNILLLLLNIYMNPDTKKKLLIGLSIAAAFVLAGIFIKNSLRSKSKQNETKQDNKPASNSDSAQTQERKQPTEVKRLVLSRDVMLAVLKKAKLNNFNLLKRISTLAGKISQQMGMSRVEPQIVKNILQSPESPVKVEDQFNKNYTQACKSFNTTYDDFKESLSFYLGEKDSEIRVLVDEIEQDYENSLKGKLPHVKVIIPADLNKERIVEIYKKLTLKKHLIQIDLFKKVRGKTQEEMRANTELLNSLPNPEEEELKILQDEGLGANDQPASAVYAAALAQYKSEGEMKAQFQKIDSHYAQIFNRYRGKIQTNRITETELNELEDELIYSDSY